MSRITFKSSVNAAGGLYIRGFVDGEADGKISANIDKRLAVLLANNGPEWVALCQAHCKLDPKAKEAGIEAAKTKQKTRVEGEMKRLTQLLKKMEQRERLNGAAGEAGGDALKDAGVE